MARPKPDIIGEMVDKRSYQCDQILSSNGIYAVYYDAKPINLRTGHYLLEGQNLKYKKVSFSNPGHAINLAKKLNQKFVTDKFTVVLLIHGQQVYPDIQKTNPD